MTVSSTAHHWGEELANALCHGLGAVFSVAGGAVLITLAAVGGSGAQLAGAIVFSVALVLLYTASTLYHAIPHPVAKRRLKVFDHCAIYVLIAGTYTPFMLIGLREHGGHWLLLTVWSLALMGIIFKLFYTGRFKLVSTLIYLSMGWLVILMAKTFLAAFSMATLFWLLGGGVAYSLGTVFYMSKRIPYAHTIWHGFVLLGSACHYVAVAMQVVPGFTTPG